MEGTAAMAATTSNRGRPVILEKTELNLGNGDDAIMRLVGDGTVVQLELPRSWSIERLERSVTRTGGRTKVQFSLDPALESVTVIPAAAPAPVQASAPAPTAQTSPAAKPRAARKKAGTPEPVAPATAAPVTTARAPRKRASKKVTAPA